MRVTILTLFPEILAAYFESSIMAKAVERGLFAYELVNFRDFAFDKHRTCDDAPYGGGAGMVLKAEPLALALDAAGAESKRTVYPSPSGRPFTQKKAEELAGEEEIVLICGRYEGVDQRIIDHYVDDEISVGDYVLSSGEVAALVIVDAIYRLREGIITPESLEEESFSNGLLEYPHYTRPEVFRNEPVPEILLSGHHEHIRQWRLRKRLEKTMIYRPDLLDNRPLDDEETKMVREIKESREESDNEHN
jgi:tRNA (guanine37-N1)-methyltransferase